MQVQKAEGAFASPIEVHETVEFTLPPVSAEAQALPVSPIEVQETVEITLPPPSAEAQALPVSLIEVQETVEVTLPPPSAEAQALPGSLIEVQETVEVTLPPPSAEAQALPKSPTKVQETEEFALPPPSAEAQAVPVRNSSVPTSPVLSINHVCVCRAQLPLSLAGNLSCLSACCHVWLVQPQLAGYNAVVGFELMRTLHLQRSPTFLEKQALTQPGKKVQLMR